MPASKFARTSRRNALLSLILAYTPFVALGMINNLAGVAWFSVRNTADLGDAWVRLAAARQYWGRLRGGNGQFGWGRAAQPVRGVGAWAGA